MKAVGTKAPIAVRLAAGLIDEGAAASLDEGLRMELAHLREIFRSKDALAGLMSVGKSRPVFEGRARRAGGAGRPGGTGGSRSSRPALPARPA